jgi:hypothetical protein
MKRMTRNGLALCLVMAAFGSSSASAQPSDDTEAFRRGWGAHGGLLVYGTGDDVNCATGAGFSLGAEARTRGRWLLGAGVDAILAAAMACTGVGVITSYLGETVDVASGTQLIGAPRLRVRGGRAFIAGNWSIEPAVGGGLIYGRTDFGGDPEWLWNAWAGASIAVRSTALPFGLEVEYGRHQVPIRYQRQDESRTVVHEFRRWKPLLRLSVVM